MELDPVDEGVLVDRARVRGAVAQGLAVGLACSSDVRLRNRRERNKLHGVDLDHTGGDPVTATLLDLWPLPKPNRQRDIAGQDVIAQLAAELHTPDASWGGPRSSTPVAPWRVWRLGRGSSLLHPWIMRWVGVHARAAVTDGLRAQLEVPRLVAVDLA